MFKNFKNTYVIYIILAFIIYLTFVFSGNWNKQDRDCKTIIKINKISPKDHPYEVKSNMCYRITIGGSYRMNFKFVSKGGKGVYFDIDNFPKGTAILVQSFENTKFKQAFASHRWGQLAAFSSVEDTFKYFKDIKANDTYYFAITTWADPNNTYGYDLYFEEVDEIDE